MRRCRKSNGRRGGRWGEDQTGGVTCSVGAGSEEPLKEQWNALRPSSCHWISTLSSPLSSRLHLAEVRFTWFFYFPEIKKVNLKASYPSPPALTSWIWSVGRWLECSASCSAVGLEQKKNWVQDGDPVKKKKKVSRSKTSAGVGQVTLLWVQLPTCRGPQRRAEVGNQTPCTAQRVCSEAVKISIYCLSIKINKTNNLLLFKIKVCIYSLNYFILKRDKWFW